MRIIYIFFALVLFSLSAHADELIDAQSCKYLTAYTPAPDVVYTPGVDVHGKPVVEADITSPVVEMPEKFNFDISFDAAKAVGLPVPPGTQSLMKIGTIVYNKGQLTFNGTPLEGQAEANLKALCAAPEKPSK
jgi:hypothetical protein